MDLLMRYASPRGTRDIEGSEVEAFRELEKTSRDIFQRYGCEEIRTPLFETTELFHRAVGETTDIVEKEMFTFSDRGGRSLTLRPEGTAGVVRAYLEHAWDKTGEIRKLFYMGPMFRAERPQAGRYREFWQIGGEFFGNPSPQADADILLLVRDILTTYGLPEIQFNLNSVGDDACRPPYRETLKNYLLARKMDLCENCQRRLETNPLRCLDCKGCGPRLLDAPSMIDFLCNDCQNHNGELKELLDSVGFSFQWNKSLVRGLDYYTRTVFEITAPGPMAPGLGAQDAIGAGGRYDGLVKQLGGPDVPAIGFALGMDRVARVRHGGTSATAPKKAPRVDSARRIFVAMAGTGTGTVGFKILRDLRQAGFTAEIGAPHKSLKAQFRWADHWGAGRVIVVGEEELKRGMVQLKNLTTHDQKEYPLTGLSSFL
jgi:histidyl-tRNA synthetase